MGDSEKIAKRKPFFVRLDEVERARLDEIARAWGTTPTAAIRRLIRESRVREPEKGGS